MRKQNKVGPSSEETAIDKSRLKDGQIIKEIFEQVDPHKRVILYMIMMKSNMRIF